MTDIQNFSDLYPSLVQPTRREELLSMVSDVYKDAHGIRPRGFNWDAYSDDELDTFVDECITTANENADAEAIWAEEQVIVFKQLVEDTIAHGAGDRATALRWLFEGSELDAYDIEHFVWQQNILYTDYGRSLKEELIGLTASLRAA